MKKIKELFIPFGFFVKLPEATESTYKSDDYITVDKGKSEQHKNYLKSIEQEEANRLNIIENKTAQLISQTGIIFSLLSLFVPILIDKVTDLSWKAKITILVFLLGAFFFYMATIWNALKNFNVKKFNYSMPSPKNVIKYQDKELGFFFAEEVKDLLYCIGTNIKITNIKANNLLYSYNSFKLANVLTGVLVFVFCIALLFFEPKKDPVTIQNPIEIKNFNTTTEKIVDAINSIHDTIYIQKPDTAKLHILPKSKRKH